MKPLKVSVLINCYNAEAYLREAIDSALSQSYPHFEIILWDNASTDNTAKIAKSYSDQRLKYYRAEKNVPLYAARNLAITKASGDLIGFLDSDDIWLPNKLEKQVPLFENPNTGIVYSDTYYFNDKGNFGRYFQNRKYYRGSCFRELLIDYFIPMPTALVRREALDHLGKVFDDRFDIIGDADTFRRVSMKWDVNYISEPLARYRIHPNSLSWEKANKLSSEIQLMLSDYKRIIPNFEQKYASEIRKLEFDAAFANAKIKIQMGDRIEARKSIRNFLEFRKAKILFAITFLPTFLINYLLLIYLKRLGVEKLSKHL